tara:strand:+ start:396 stop:515 length:120 start_codon:yes stop_codon:yes gene_type:complete
MLRLLLRAALCINLSLSPDLDLCPTAGLLCLSLRKHPTL